MKLGRNIDNLIIDIIQWNRRKPWYKFYCYYFIKINISKYSSIIEIANNHNYLYLWQYEKLNSMIHK